MDVARLAGFDHAVVVGARPTQAACSRWESLGHVAGEALGSQCARTGITGVMAWKARPQNINIPENTLTSIGDQFPVVTDPTTQTFGQRGLAGGTGGVTSLASRCGRVGEEIVVASIAGASASAGVEGSELSGVAV